MNNIDIKEIINKSRKAEKVKNFHEKYQADALKKRLVKERRGL